MGARRVRHPGNIASNEELLALPAEYGAPPDVPIDAALMDAKELLRVARAHASELGKLGVSKRHLDNLSAAIARLGELESDWTKAHDALDSASGKRKTRADVAVLVRRFRALAEYACSAPSEHARLTELSRAREGGALVDAIADLRELVAFFDKHRRELARIDLHLGRNEVEQCRALASDLEALAIVEASSEPASFALDLRNRCFWALDELVREIRLAGRVALSDEPTAMLRFRARFRAAPHVRPRRTRRTTRPPSRVE